MVTGFVTVVHVLVALVLIVVVLLQSQQSMNLSGMFGGASQSALGSKPQSVLSKTTTVLAIVFMLTSLLFAVWPRQDQGVLAPSESSQGGINVPTAPQSPESAPSDPQSPSGSPSQPSNQSPAPGNTNS